MPDIHASPSSAALTIAAKQTEDNTHNTEELLALVRDEIFRLRIGDTSERDEQVTR